VFQPVSTGITYSVLDKVAQDKIPMVTIGYGRTDAADGRVFPWVFPMITYWSQASAIVTTWAGRWHGQAEGQEDRPALPRLGLWQSHAIMDKLAAKHGFEVIKIAVAHPGNEQQSQWLQIRQAKPDYVCCGAGA
jgi:branched-chain amino acid transport system substrate-binding protein